MTQARRTESGLRERTRRAVRAELAAAATDLFLAQGFDATTVEQIAAAAGLSRRSFFRYFSSKDDVLGQVMLAAGENIAARLRARPAGEPPWPALRRSLDGLVAQMESDSGALPTARLVLHSPALQASHLHKQASWRAVIAAELGPRLAAHLDEDERRLRADALSGACLACFHSAQVEWVAQDGRRPPALLLDAAMEAVAPLQH